MRLLVPDPQNKGLRAVNNIARVETIRFTNFAPVGWAARPRQEQLRHNNLNLDRVSEELVLQVACRISGKFHNVWKDGTYGMRGRPSHGAIPPLAGCQGWTVYFKFLCDWVPPGHRFQPSYVASVA